MEIVFALEMSLQQAWVKEKELSIESASKNAVAWVNGKDKCSLNLRYILLQQNEKYYCSLKRCAFCA